jgi:hypothetical protein
MTDEPKRRDAPSYERSTFFDQSKISDESEMEPSEVVGSKSFQGYPAASSPWSVDAGIEPPLGEAINALPALGGSSPPAQLTTDQITAIITRRKGLSR